MCFACGSVIRRFWEVLNGKYSQILGINWPYYIALTRSNYSSCWMRKDVNSDAFFLSQRPMSLVEDLTIAGL